MKIKCISPNGMRKTQHERIHEYGHGCFCRNCGKVFYRCPNKFADPNQDYVIQS